MTSPRAVTALSSASIAGGLGVAVHGDSTTTINRAVRKRIHPLRSAALRSVAKGISYLADPHSYPFVAATLGLLINRNEGRVVWGPSQRHSGRSPSTTAHASSCTSAGHPKPGVITVVTATVIRADT
jgi:hypothetical protein